MDEGVLVAVDAVNRKVLSSLGLYKRPIFGDIPPARQEGVLTVIDCIGKS